MIRRHPQDGAALVGKLDGYGPVADAILYHHEQIDGGGYPAGLIGNEIPLPSRIVAICSTYDTLTARDSYRSPMTPQDAMAELRRVAGRQLDAELVELLHRDARARRPGGASPEGDDADFAAELAFEKRVRKMAQPSRQLSRRSAAAPRRKAALNEQRTPHGQPRDALKPMPQPNGCSLGYILVL